MRRVTLESANLEPRHIVGLQSVCEVLRPVLAPRHPAAFQDDVIGAAYVESGRAVGFDFRVTSFSRTVVEQAACAGAR